MKVVVLNQSAHRPEYRETLEQFTQGINRHCEVELKDGFGDPARYDIAVIYGSHKPERGSLHHQIKTKVTTEFKRFVQIETPILSRRADTIIHDWFRVGVNGFLWDEGQWGFEHMDEQRYKDIFRKCGYDLDQKWNNGGTHILILMQNPGDASLRGQDIYEWTDQTIQKIKKLTDRPIVVRPHPLKRKNANVWHDRYNSYDNVKVVKNNLPNNLRPLEQDFKDCWCTVSYTSGSAVDAVLAGIPNIACDSGNMAWLASSHSINDIENPYRGDRMEWMKKIVNCQWSREELQNGVCWNHIQKTLVKY